MPRIASYPTTASYAPAIAVLMLFLASSSVADRVLNQEAAVANTSAKYFSFPVTSLFKAKLTGSAVVPSVNHTNASGTATIIIYNSTLALATVEIKNIDNVFMAHIHAGNETTDGPPVVWALNSTCCGGQWQPFSVQGKTAWSTTYTFDPKATGVGALLESKQAYFNVHTLKWQNGEIRGQFHAVEEGSGTGSAVTYCGPIQKVVTATTARTVCSTCGTGKGGGGRNTCLVTIKGAPVPIEKAAEVAGELQVAAHAGFVY